jgi:hypothetical protein
MDGAAPDGFASDFSPLAAVAAPAGFVGIVGS